MKLQNIKSGAQKGFTLIELMITVAIVGILSAIALPAYNDYTIRAQASEGLVLADGAKVNVAESYANDGTLPADNAAANYAGSSGKYVSGVAINAGVITSTFGGSANSSITGKTVTLTPTVAASGNLTWVCSGSADKKYLPKSCQ